MLEIKKELVQVWLIDCCFNKCGWWFEINIFIFWGYIVVNYMLFVLVFFVVQRSGSNVNFIFIIGFGEVCRWFVGIFGLGVI